MAKPKYSPETKLAVVNHYLSGKDGEQSTADLFGIERTSVRRWVRAWQFHGAEGLTAKNNHYSDEFKLVVVRAVISDRLTMREAAARFNLSAEILVRRWLDVYNDAGAEGLLNMQCGRPGQMTKPKNIPPLTDKELEKLSPRRAQGRTALSAGRECLSKKVESLGSERKKWQKALIISELRHEHALRDLLRAAGMSRSTWYYNMNALKQGDRYAGLKENIRKIYHYHKGRYGYRRITLALRKQGLRINHKTVQRLMAELSLRSVIRAKKYRAWKGRTGEAAPNILSRNFGASKANEKWVTDVTEFPVQGKKLYLSSVLDLFNREVIAYSLSERPVMEMVNTMLDGAFPKLRPGDAPLLHSDQGWHYRMRSYQERLKAHGMTQSMSRKGNCLDNAVMENFFGTLKSECFYLREFRSVSALRKAVEDYIHYYNNERISLKLKGLSPVEYRTQALRAA
ncbi:IS3 family transposase [Klebsiella pneumoniae]|uniref:IS3 family transposase n=1 Tax=Klebsiella pneumoniae TaxID=573 RepID=UPI00058236D7|nr:IS3 family transposase [Klebsiella pneumoniae]AJC02285.1 Mobile element protein [Klebsiella pneumoniae subsp. pneumoniae 1158]AJC02411.1 Mobile element protein [Klebsiella pneumoniae subsp. pneumoniae 1158]AJC04122.1 Mobile element protein [Klebsiella pneumoniae subsp. pneumoniae 1158]AJC04619.1 Mobile element protein [Klebsiella pneumoniae subsp. pneumoniae 1158]AJC05768.1 Mobile element protein [Klebsiella pneumoniae subsp. pneumoniae 1158]